MRIYLHFALGLVLQFPFVSWPHHQVTVFSVKAKGIPEQYRMSIKYQGRKGLEDSYHLTYWLEGSAVSQLMPFINRQWDRMSPLEFHTEVSKALTDHPWGYFGLNISHCAADDEIVVSDSAESMSGSDLAQQFAKILELSAEGSSSSARREYTSLLVQPFWIYSASLSVHDSHGVLDLDVVDTEPGSDSDSVGAFSASIDPGKRVVLAKVGRRVISLTLEKNQNLIGEPHYHYLFAKFMDMQFVRDQPKRPPEDDRQPPPPGGGEGLVCQFSGGCTNPIDWLFWQHRVFKSDEDLILPWLNQ